MSDTDLEDSQLYSEELEIELTNTEDSELFKWFLASILYGARISEDVATQTYREFEKHDLLTPESILDAGKDYLIDPIMREGGYVRYDNQRSTQVIENCHTLLERHDGDLNELHEESVDSDDLHDRLTNFDGIGDVTANIFLRELRPYWAKSDPKPLPVVEDTAEAYDIDLDQYDRNTETFARIEAGLIRKSHE